MHPHRPRSRVVRRSACTRRLDRLNLRNFYFGLCVGCTVCLLGTRLAAETEVKPQTGEPPSAALTLALGLSPDDRDLIKIDEATDQYFAQRIDRSATEDTKLSQLLDALRARPGGMFVYETDGTYCAEDTFKLGRGNCVSFSLLLMAVARRHGLTASCQEINDHPQWYQVGAHYVAARHLNVLIKTDRTTYVVNLQPNAAILPEAAESVMVSDQRIFAHFFNNLAVLRLTNGDYNGSLELFERALKADPAAAFVRCNQGQILLVMGRRDEAQRCLERTYKDNPKDPAVITCLSNFYRQTGHPSLAKRLEKLAEKYRLQNPFYLHALAKNEFRAGNSSSAASHVRRAIKLRDDVAAFYLLAIEIALSQDRTTEASKWAKKLQARHLTSPPANPALVPPVIQEILNTGSQPSR